MPICVSVETRRTSSRIEILDPWFSSFLDKRRKLDMLTFHLIEISTFAGGKSNVLFIGLQQDLLKCLHRVINQQVAISCNILQIAPLYSAIFESN